MVLAGRINPERERILVIFLTKAPGSLKRSSSHLVKEAEYIILPEN
jgi:hypothetical protein